MNEMKSNLSEKDLPQKSNSFFSNHHIWFSNMFGAFVATVLGIAVTIGVSKYKDYNKNKEVIKALVFNALSDLDNYEAFLRNDSVAFSQINWLKGAIEDFYRNDRSFPVDSFANSINATFGYRNHFREDYSPIGKDFMSLCQIQSVEDLETFRVINIAYEDALHSYTFLEEMKECVDDLNDVWLEMYYNHKRYFSSEVVEKILSHESAHKLCLMMNERFLLDGKELGFFEYYIKVIDSHRQRILLFAGADMEEYQQFNKKRKGVTNYDE